MIAAIALCFNACDSSLAGGNKADGAIVDALSAADAALPDSQSKLDTAPDNALAPDGAPSDLTADAVAPGADAGTGLPFSPGTIVAADYANLVNPISIWRYVTDGYHLGGAPYDPASDPQITHSATGGDPMVAFDGQIHSAYRRLETDGKQAIWDAQNQPDQTRAQLGGWSASSSIHISQPGTRELISFSVPLDPTTPLPYDVNKCDGNYQCTHVMQIKSINPQQGPMLKVYEGKNGMRLIYKAGAIYEDDLANLPRDKTRQHGTTDLNELS